VEDVKLLSDYLKTLALTKREISKFFYEVEFNKGGMMMPILVEITYEDGTVENCQLKSGEK
jgi:hypothetical protein